jgi:hypothetical protein
MTAIKGNLFQPICEIALAQTAAIEQNIAEVALVVAGIVEIVIIENDVEFITQTVEGEFV